ncbi:arginine--tRNA ligase, partial [Candidatus Wolfebacteria bacterium]|nr:arginine--tRNA ligase [Candidatus Wolfebacteria bacterium]
MIELVEKRLQEATPQRIEGTISTSDKKEFGHYTSNVAFKLAKEMKKSPFEVAQDLAKNLSSFNEFKKVEAIAPGFINFWISSEILQDSVKKILKEKKSFGKSKVKKSKKINIEFVSANPTGPLTMANGRGGFYGDVLSNVLESVGHKVTREYYVNDAGNQVRLLGESIKAVEGKIEDKEEYYKGDYIKKLKGKTAKQAIAILLKEIKKSLKKAGINQDVFFSEDKNLHKKDELNKVLKFLKKKKMIVEKDGALWLGDNVLVKSDGNPTYFLADLAYHYDKLIKRKFDLAID